MFCPRSGVGMRDSPHRGYQEADRREVAAQAPAEQERERQRDQPAGHSGAEPWQREGQVPAADVGLEPTVGGVGRQRQDRGRVTAGRLEDDEAEVGDARHAELLVQAQAGHGVDGRVDQQVDRVEGHPRYRPAVMSAHPAARWGARRA
jgi:hypothetical protein